MEQLEFFIRPPSVKIVSKRDNGHLQCFHCGKIPPHLYDFLLREPDEGDDWVQHHKSFCKECMEKLTEILCRGWGVEWNN